MVAVLKTLLPENVSNGSTLDHDQESKKIRGNYLEATDGLSKKLRAIFGVIDNKISRTAKSPKKLCTINLSEDQRSNRHARTFGNGLQKKEESWTFAHFEDPRLRELHARLKTKIAPEKLTKRELQDYHEFVRQQLVRTDRSLKEVQETTKDLLKKETRTEETLALQDFQDYLQKLAIQYDVENTG